MEGKDKIKSNAAIIEDEKTAKRREETAQAEARAERRKQKALDARKAGVAKSEPSKKTKSSKELTDSLLENIDGKTVLAGMAAIGGLARNSAAKKAKKSLTTTLVLIAVILVAAVVLVLLLPRIKETLFPTPEPPLVTIDEFTAEDQAELLKNRTIEIKDVVVGEARQRKELLVLEQDISVDSVWEQSWGGLDLFTKTKKIISYGTGYYNIDLSGINGDSVNVDEVRQSVIITVPHAFLKSISIDESKTQYEDTQKGLLSFGDIKLTMEQQGLLKTSVEGSMRNELSKPEMLEEADRIGILMVGDIYQPLISAISEEYYVEVVITG